MNYFSKDTRKVQDSMGVGTPAEYFGSLLKVHYFTLIQILNS